MLGMARLVSVQGSASCATMEFCILEKDLGVPPNIRSVAPATTTAAQTIHFDTSVTTSIFDLCHSIIYANLAAV